VRDLPKLLRASPSLLSAKAIIISAPTAIMSEVSARANIHFYHKNVKKEGKKPNPIALTISN